MCVIPCHERQPAQSLTASSSDPNDVPRRAESSAIWRKHARLLVACMVMLLWSLQPAVRYESLAATAAAMLIRPPGPQFSLPPSGALRASTNMVVQQWAPQTSELKAPVESEQHGCTCWSSAASMRPGEAAGKGVQVSRAFAVTLAGNAGCMSALLLLINQWVLLRSLQLAVGR